MSKNHRTVAVLNYGATPEAAAVEEQEENGLQSTLQIIQDIAPTVQRLVAGLPPAEQAAVLKAKIAQMQQYTTVPGVGMVCSTANCSVPGTFGRSGKKCGIPTHHREKNKSAIYHWNRDWSDGLGFIRCQSRQRITSGVIHAIPSLHNPFSYWICPSRYGGSSSHQWSLSILMLPP